MKYKVTIRQKFQHYFLLQLLEIVTIFLEILRMQSYYFCYFWNIFSLFVCVNCVNTIVSIFTAVMHLEPKVSISIKQSGSKARKINKKNAYKKYFQLVLRPC